MIALLRHLILEDFWLKLFSLALAILIWLTVSFAQKEGAPASPLSLKTIQRTFYNLPVRVMLSADEVRTVKIKPSEVLVTVQGDRKILQNLQSRDIRVTVDLSGVEAATMRKRIDVSTPAGVTHVRVTPEEVQVIVPPKT